MVFELEVHFCAAELAKVNRVNKRSAGNVRCNCFLGKLDIAKAKHDSSPFYWSSSVVFIVCAILSVFAEV